MLRTRHNAPISKYQDLLHFTVLCSALFSACDFTPDPIDPTRPPNGEVFKGGIFYVRQDETIIDSAGFPTEAICQNDEVYFNGWWDADCNSIICSTPTQAELQCLYADRGTQRVEKYSKIFKLPRGQVAYECDPTTQKATMYPPPRPGELSKNLNCLYTPEELIELGVDPTEHYQKQLDYWDQEGLEPVALPGSEN